MAAVGAIQPIMILLLTFLFWGGQIVTGPNLLAFFILLAGSILISIDKGFRAPGRYTFLVLLCAFMFSLDYVFSKLIFSSQPFLQGLVWMRIASTLIALAFLFDAKLRRELLANRPRLSDPRQGWVFFAGQFAGAIAGVLQSFAIAIVPVSYLAIINSLRGVQYIFLFLITLFFSRFFPNILKETISAKVIVQKVVAILLIVLGLAMLVSY